MSSYINMRTISRDFTKVCFGLVLVATLILPSILPSPKASAAYAPDFQAGNIIGDSLFFDSGSMTQDQIQQFLNSLVPNCDTNGTQTSEYGGGTRAQYGASRGYPAPYICLRNYYENPTTHANNLGGTMPTGGWSAAQIISNAATTYGVSPKILLATLQKESVNLLYDTWPFPNAYIKPMGYGCPDSAPCDSQYYGFYNQVTNAARQFKLYASSPSSYRYKANQNNTILYNPSTSCGSSTVFIQNQATAGLYNYTPYQPNAAALNNLYGMGDSCSAYGNRNFWRIYTDLFGSTMGSDLVRSSSDATVYLLSGANKYPIADGNVLNDYSALGNVLYVSDTFLNAHTTGSLLGHMVSGTDGTIYFIDAGIKLPFSSCAMVASYGYSCNAITYLTSGQLNRFSTGPYVTSLYKTTSGKLFYISGATKREVFDQQSLTAAGITDATNVLVEGGISYLPYGQPVSRDSVVVHDRGDGKNYLYDSANYWTLNDDINSGSALKNLPVSSLDDQSIPTIQKKGNFSGFISDSTGTNKYIVLSNGKAKLTSPATWSANYITLGDATIGAIPVSTSPINNQLVKSPNDGTVYYIGNGTKRSISAWSDLLSLQINPLVISSLFDTELNQIPNGASLYGLGTLVKAPDSGTVYIVQDTTHLMPISSFLYAQELGIPLNVRTMSSADFQAYSVTGTVQTKIACGGVNYIGINGSLYSFSANQLTQYGFNAGDFVNATSLCSNLTVNAQGLPNFIRTPDGTIYIVQNGKKQAFTSYTAFLAAGGSSQNTAQVSNYFASLIVSGSNITQ